ncbi:hypothetical protein BLGI_4734 [Brevibacillus laterosporus GI-9]|nr:hypothetical protein BLGI_4734 [Brevibacillus laterosporus GI-9]
MKEANGCFWFWEEMMANAKQRLKEEKNIHSFHVRVSMTLKMEDT